MNAPRYQELLGRALDDELRADELDEFAEGLRSSPDRLADFQFNLVLWELFSQQRQDGRSADAFVASWKARLAAERVSASLVDRAVEQVESPASQPPTQTDPKPSAPVDRPSIWDWFRGLWKALAARPLAGALCAGVAVALLVGLYAYYFGPPIGEPILAEVQGDGLVLERGGRSLSPVARTPLRSGDTLRTPDNVTVDITFGPERSRIAIQPNTEVQLGPWSTGKRFSIAYGKLEASLARQRPFRPMVLRTPQAKARVLGTKFALSVTTNASRLEVKEGKVLFTRHSDGAAVKVPSGYYAVAESNVLLAPLPVTGSVLREVWTNIAGVQWVELLRHTNFPGQPDTSSYVTNYSALETPSNWGTNYGQRLRGYIHPPKTGDYVFWIASQDWGSLYLSPDDDPENKVHMANCPGGAGPHEWDKWPAQHSSTVQLTAGKKYYFEIMHKVGTGQDNLALAWQGPGRQQQIIPIEYVSPFKTK